jgi:hypothetical protein
MEWEQRCSQLHALTRHLMDVSGKLHTTDALPRGENHRYPLDMRLDEPQTRSESYGEEKNTQESNSDFLVQTHITLSPS